MYIFINNKYSTYYWSIIARATARVNSGYVEKHHIIPKSLGGSYKKSNMVELTAKEHFVCHKLLTKMTTGKDRTKMVYALWAMAVHTTKHTKTERSLVTGARFERARLEYISVIAGKPKTKEHRAKLGKYERTAAHRENLAETRRLQTGKHTRSDETKQRMSAWQKGVPKPKHTCQHCQKEMNLVNLKRWHGDNCKRK